MGTTLNGRQVITETELHEDDLRFHCEIKARLLAADPDTGAPGAWEDLEIDILGIIAVIDGAEADDGGIARSEGRIPGCEQFRCSVSFAASVAESIACRFGDDEQILSQIHYELDAALGRDLAS